MYLLRALPWQIHVVAVHRLLAFQAPSRAEGALRARHPRVGCHVAAERAT